jgi:hypothetical protein
VALDHSQNGPLTVSRYEIMCFETSRPTSPLHRAASAAGERDEPLCGPTMGGVRMRLSPIAFCGIVFVLATLVAACGPEAERSSTARPSRPSPSTSREWYSGGTLHAKSVAEWRSASRRDRLATSADFVMKLGDYRSLPSDLRRRSEELETCISKAVEGGEVDTRPVSEIGAACAVLLGY